MSESPSPLRDGVTVVLLEKEAADLLRQVRKGAPEAIGRFYTFADSAEPGVPDALYVIAREYGFDTWAKLKRHVEIAQAS